VDQLKEIISKASVLVYLHRYNKREILFLDTKVTYDREFQHSQG